MTNIINELEQRNKELLEEINNLNKKREADIEELKLKIWHVTGQSLDDKGEVSIHAPRGTWWYKKLNKKWMDEGKLRMAVDPNETREWAKSCKRIWFDNITIEEMLDGFIDSSNELGSTCSEYISNWSKRGYQLTEQRREFEKKLEELEKSKDQQIKELEEEIRELEEALELEENISKCHLDAREVARKWRVRQSKEKDENLEKASRKIEMLENVVAWQNYLTNKQLQELPSLPKKQNKFKLPTNKVKSRIKQAKAITQEKFDTYILQKDK